MSNIAMRPLLLTRPPDDIPPLQQALAAQGIATLAAPLLRIIPIPYHVAMDTAADALFVTSRHAVAAAAAFSHLPAYAVGEQTAEKLQKAGVANIIAHAPEMRQLVPQFRAEHRRILYFSGKHTRHDAAALLPDHHILQHVVYEAQAASNLPSAILTALENTALHGVVFYSPRTAMIFHQLTLPQHRAECVAYCLSEAVAAECMGWREVIIAPHPTHAAMLELLTQSCVSDK